ncbi:hypothetical protein GBAR_LOCUS172 [Geodia barretti]|uniref:SRCR domain-containing protein n=2 Tax=Geodia barretti TaxID=519541 RepID=A0AA35VRM8_GEOBA|nr:hypothetical protein GBAR_LOCUS172 [Geodia barretti]
MRSHVWSLLAALLRVLLVRGASPEDPSPECSDEDLRLLTSFEDNDDISAALDGVLGDVRGILEICENELWKSGVVLCLNEGDGGTELWTMENTAVACRELRWMAPGESGAIGHTESSRKLSYIPQCMGSEEKLEDCSTLNHTGNCDAPLVISCSNSSTSQPSPSLTISSATSFTSSVSKPAATSPVSLMESSTTAVSATELQQPSLTTGSCLHSRH